MTPDANDLCVFAIKRGDIDKRLDVHFYLPQYQQIVKRIKKCKQYSTIGDSAVFSKETTDFSEYPDGKFEYLEISGVELGSNTYKTTVTEVSQAPSRAKMKTQLGDIVISTTRPHRGAIAEIKTNGIIASTGFSIIRDVDSCINKTFLLYTMFSNIVLQQMAQRSSGGNYPAIVEEEIKKIYLPIPEYPTQQKLVDFMDDANISRQNKINQSEKLLSLVNEYIFDALNLSRIVFEERICCTINLSNIIEDKTFSAEYYHPERMTALHLLKSNTGIPAHKLSDIVTFHRNLVSAENSTDYLGLAGVESQTGELSGIQEEAAGQAFVYEKDDILYGRLRPYLNKVLLAEKGGICSTEFHVMRVIDTTTVLPEYVAAILRSNLILAQTKHMMTGNTHPRISNDDVQNLYIPIPDICVQTKVVDDLRKHRIEARKLKMEAEQEWQEAKEQFEKELLE